MLEVWDTHSVSNLLLIINSQRISSLNITLFNMLVNHYIGQYAQVLFTKCSWMLAQ